MKDYVLNVFFKNAMKYDISVEDFWNLTPITLSIVIQAKCEKQKEYLEIQDNYNWQLGQYIRLAVGSCLSDKCKYPTKPLFSKLENEERELSEQEKQNERLKAKLFFSNLGDYVAIKNK